MRPAFALRILAGALLAAAALPVSAGQPAPLHHVVFCWLKEPGNEAHRAEIIRVTRELTMIPELRSVAVGTPVPGGGRAVADDSFDVGVVMTFRNPEELQAYVQHPEHVRRLRETLQPLCGRVLVYDFIDAP
jgi:hypothetical protein